MNQAKHVHMSNSVNTRLVNNLRGQNLWEPSSTRNSWREKSRKNKGLVPTTLNRPNFSHLTLPNGTPDRYNQATVKSIWKRKLGRNRSMKSPKVAKYLANIEARFNDPMNMKNAVNAVPNSNLSENEKKDLIKNIDELFPDENYNRVKRGVASRRLVPMPSRPIREATDANWEQLERNLAKIKM
jgi:hypothetical protein